MGASAASTPSASCLRRGTWGEARGRMIRCARTRVRTAPCAPRCFKDSQAGAMPSLTAVRISRSRTTRPTKDELDIMRWDYGYAWWPRWWRGWGLRWRVGPTEATEYGSGTVVVDVIDPKTRELLWRGKGLARVSDDERAYELDLQKTVTAIVARSLARGHRSRTLDEAQRGPARSRRC